MTKLRLAETLLIEGPDALAFAQAQFSSPVLALEPGCWQFSAWLDPQGRVRSLFHLGRASEDKLILLLRGGQAFDLATSLRRFVFRSRLVLTVVAPRFFRTGLPAPINSMQLGDGALSFGCGEHSLVVTDTAPTDDSWRLLQMDMGWPWLPDSQLDSLLPPALALQHLQAVVIDKGCYPGQEVVARLHFRGGNKRHLHRVRWRRYADSITIPAAGDTLRIDGDEVGCLLDTVIDKEFVEALAVLRDDCVARSTNGRLDVLDGNHVIDLVDAWPA